MIRTGPGSYLYRRSATHLHRGVDLAAPIGTPVYAPAAGVVVRVAEPGTVGFRGYGRAAVVRSGGVYQLFGHLEDLEVRPGDRLEAGELLGTIGRTGVKRSKAHLHYEVSEHPYPMASEAPRIDPVEWLSDGRLHPLARRPANPLQFPAPLRRPASGAIAAAVLLSTALAVALAMKG